MDKVLHSLVLVYFCISITNGFTFVRIKDQPLYSTADLVVVGTPLKSFPEESQNNSGTYVTGTIYDVDVEEVLKGTIELHPFGPKVNKLRVRVRGLILSHFADCVSCNFTLLHLPGSC